MPTSTTTSRSAFSILAIVLGVLAVVAVTASFVTDATWELRAAGLVLIILGLGVGRVALRRPPTSTP